MNKSPIFSTVRVVLGLTVIIVTVLILIRINQPVDKKYMKTSPAQTNDIDLPEVYKCSGKYLNNAYKFSIICPDDWTITMFEKDKEYKSDGTNPLDENSLAHFKFVAEDATVRFDISISENNDSFVTNGNTEEASNNVKQLSDIVVAGIPSQKFSSTGPGSVIITVITKKNGVTYKFIMDEKYWDEEEKAKTDEIYSNFLSSFTFL